MPTDALRLPLDLHDLKTECAVADAIDRYSNGKARFSQRYPWRTNKPEIAGTIGLEKLLTRSDRERIAEEMREAADGWRTSGEITLADRCDWIAGVFLMAAQEAAQ